MSTFTLVVLVGFGTNWSTAITVPGFTTLANCRSSAPAVVQRASESSSFIRNEPGQTRTFCVEVK